jgi:hypothetical protein
VVALSVSGFLLLAAGALVIVWSDRLTSTPWRWATCAIGWIVTIAGIAIVASFAAS